MVKPGAGDLGSPSVSQDIVLHAFHTRVLSHFGAEWGLVLFHFWERSKHRVFRGAVLVPGVKGAGCSLRSRSY